MFCILVLRHYCLSVWWILWNLSCWGWSSSIRSAYSVAQHGYTATEADQTSHVLVELQDCMFMFVRQDTHCTLIYSAHTNVPSKFKNELQSISYLDLHGKRDTVPVDRFSICWCQSDFSEEPISIKTQPVTPSPFSTTTLPDSSPPVAFTPCETQPKMPGN